MIKLTELSSNDLNIPCNNLVNNLIILDIQLAKTKKKFLNLKKRKKLFIKGLMFLGCNENKLYKNYLWINAKGWYQKYNKISQELLQNAKKKFTF